MMTLFLLLGVLCIGVPGSSQIWKEVESPVSWDLLDLFFVDDRHGWAVAEEGMIRTTDGGETWEILHGIGGSTVWFWDIRNGILAREELIWITRDGGDTWNPFSRTSTEPTRLFFHNRNQGWLVSRYDLSRTFDGGHTWETVDLPLPKQGTRGRSMDTGGYSCCYGMHFRDIYFSDEQRGWVVG